MYIWLKERTGSQAARASIETACVHMHISVSISHSSLR